MDSDNSQNQIQYAVLIKKNVGSAVKRNYCKRIVREFIRINKDKFGINNKIVFLFTYKGKVNYWYLNQELSEKMEFK